RSARRALTSLRSPRGETRGETSYLFGMHTLFFDFGNVIAAFDHRIAVRRFCADCDIDPDACFAAVYDTALEDDFEAGRVTADEFVRRSCAAIGYRGTPDGFRTAFADIFTPNREVCD